MDDRAGARRAFEDPVRRHRGTGHHHACKAVTPVCRAARARKIPIVIDFDLKTTTDDPLLKLGSHVIASAEALRATTGLTDLGAGLARMATTISGFLAVTDGPNGVFWLENGTLRRLPAFSVTTIDTLAAGDVFHAGFTLALAEGRDLVGALRFASAAAAIKCTRFGGAAGAPLRAEVEQFLRQRGETESLLAVKG